MLLSLLSGGKTALFSILMSLPIILFSLSFHEAAHAFVAHKLGDETANYTGRMTLNPLSHIDPIGFLCMAVCGIGWAKPVPINARNFKDPRKGMAIVGIAGPISNLLLGVVFAILYSLSLFLSYKIGYTESNTTALTLVQTFFYIGGYLNFSLMLFNLIPIPPFDGSRFFNMILPASWYFKIMKYERYTGLILLVILFALSRLGINPVSILAGGLFSLVTTPFLLLFTLFL